MTKSKERQPHDKGRWPSKLMSEIVSKYESGTSVPELVERYQLTGAAAEVLRNQLTGFSSSREELDEFVDQMNNFMRYEQS